MRVSSKDASRWQVSANRAGNSAEAWTKDQPVLSLQNHAASLSQVQCRLGEYAMDSLCKTSGKRNTKSSEATLVPYP